MTQASMFITAVNIITLHIINTESYFINKFISIGYHKVSNL